MIEAATRQRPQVSEIQIKFEGSKLFPYYIIKAHNFGWHFSYLLFHGALVAILFGISHLPTLRGVISTFSWGANFFYIFQCHRTTEKFEKQHFIWCSNFTLFIVPFFFSLFSFLFFLGGGGDGPPAPLKWRLCRHCVTQAHIQDPGSSTQSSLNPLSASQEPAQ